MKRRAFELTLLLLVLVGGVLAWKSDRERARLGETYRRLTRITGELPIGDPTKVHLRALETGEPLHYAWRIYYPPGYNQLLVLGNESQSTNVLTAPGEFIIRLKFKEGDDGRLAYYAHLPGSTTWHYGDKPLADFLRGRWDQILVEQMGSDGVVALDPNKPDVLLRLSLPGPLLDEARRDLNPATLNQLVPELLHLNIGPPKLQK
jgi:hypothetical protein